MDYLIRGINKNKKIIAYVARTTKLVEEARIIHQASPTAIAALGRVLTLTAIMGKMLKKKEETISLQIVGNGPLGNIIADADFVGNVRGYIKRPYIDLPPTAEGKLDVPSAVGKEGILSVVRDLGLKEPYKSVTHLVSGGIAKDLAYYFIYSEQQPSAVAAGVYVGKDSKVISAGGYIVQTLPETEEELISNIERNINNLEPPSKMILNGKTPEEIMSSIFIGIDYEMFHPEPLQYSCRCSLERAENALIALGEKELEDLLKKERKIDVKCEFCSKIYSFGKEQIEELIRELKNES
ncbi:MAG TPA: Hsp33 family molecular chaperone HslO [Dictyoglomaceae bacterium]|nr:Hsp33 family molecular chaperone HslO [Dictyoglomaceae bacterium]